jgi:hypothetical protein
VPRKLLEHPIVPILLGALITWDAPGNVKVRSYTLLFFFLWCSWDIWRFITDNQKEWYGRHRNILFCLAVGIAANAMMLTMHWMLDLKLEEQQKETFAKLNAEIRMPPSGNPFQSEITVTNGSSYVLSKHEVICGINAADFEFARKEDYEAWQKIPENQRPPMGGLSGFSWLTTRPSTEPLEPYGDARTDICSPMLGINETNTRVSCMDVTIQIVYALETQPEIKKRKDFHFVAREIGGGFMWHNQPVESKMKYCQHYSR